MTAILRALSKEQILQAIDDYTDTVTLAEQYFWSRYLADPKWDVEERVFSGFYRRPYIETTTFYADQDICEVYVEGQDEDEGGHTYKFPISYLWTDQTLVLADIKRKGEEAEAARVQREIERMKVVRTAENARDLQEYNRLKARLTERKVLV